MDKTLLEAPSVAIVGMAGRFPGANNLEKFWDNLVNGVEGITQLTDDDLAKVEPDYEELKLDPDYIRAAGILDGVDMFDADFFGIKPREAKAMDPQHRIWLETAWAAMEHSGYAPNNVAGQIGVFTGSYINSYLFYNLSPDRETIEGFVRLQSLDSFLNMITNEKDYLPTRTSYLMNLRGPSINVQTACSTSLVAVAQACQSLLSYESDMALAGGVAIFLPQERGYFYTEGGMLSSDGHCAPFSDKGSGTVFGSGVGCVVLKRYEDALEDNDNILAVIRGTALNNDGAYKASYTAPSIDGQAEVIAMAQAVAGVEPEQIGYIEAHGTATPLGDPIEVAGLSKAFHRKTDKHQFCAIGAVKSSIGHLDAASGVAGLIKTVLTLQNEELPPIVHFERENPEIEFATTPFYPVAERTPWKRSETPRIAGISSFGVGGTNAHAIVQEAPLREAGDDGRKRNLFMLSAKTETALETMAQNLADAFEEKKSLEDFSFLADAAFTLTFGRTQHKFRRSVVAADAQEAIDKLRKSARATATTQSNPEIVFMFPGQGAQYPNMGRELYDNEAVFRDAVDRCAEILQPLLGEDLCEIMYPEDKKSLQDFSCLEAAAEKLKNTGLAQPAIFTVEYALAQLWLSWGIKPSRMIGHSVGEFTAACIAGVFSLEDALKVIAERATLMKELPGGAMRAVRLSAEDLKPYLGLGVELAAHNAPDITVVSGEYDAIEAFDQRMAALGLETITLHTSHAFHSAMMEPILEPFNAIVASVERNAPTLPIISTVTGSLLSDAEATDPSYWTSQLRQPVLFANAIQKAMAQPGQVFLEVGPSKNLSSAAQQHAQKEQQHVVIDSLGHAKKQQPALEALLSAAGKLWMAGVTVDWEAFYADQQRGRVALPTYPFERKRYWIEPPQLKKEETLDDGQQTTAGRPSAVLAASVPQVQPLPVAVSQVEAIGAWPQTTGSVAPAVVQSPSSVGSSPEVQVSIMTRREQILNRVREMLYELSGMEIDSADYDTSFVELGFDSLTLTQVSTVIKRQFKQNVKFRRLLEDISTLNLLTDHFDGALPDDMFVDEVVSEQLAVSSEPSQMNGQPTLATSNQQPAYQQPMMPQPQMQMPQQQIQMPMQQMPMPQMGMMNPIMMQMQQQMMMMQQMYQQMMAGMMMPMGFQQPMMPMQQPQQQPVMPQVAPAAQTMDVGRQTTDGTSPSSRNNQHATPSDNPKAPAYSDTQNVSNKRFGPYKEIKKGKDGDLTPSQQAHLDKLMTSLVEKTGKSKVHAQNYRDVQADPRTIAAFRQTWKEIVYQIVTDGSKGSKVWDIDGNEYVDLTMGFGVSFLGHSPEFVTEAIKRQIDKGLEIGPQSKEAGEVSRMMSELTGAERVSFCNTGSEAIMAAIRMARTTTARDKIVWFSGDYHGTFDEVLARPQIMRGELQTMPAAPGILPEAVNGSYILEYGDPASLDFIREHKDELAAVLIETVQSRHPHNRPKAFVEELRKITAESGTALIFDEVITGFRIHPKGMQHVYGVKPDLSCYGKILGGGIPIGAVAGSAEFMDGIDGGYWQYGDDSVPEADLTFFAGTFVRHPMAMAAAKAVLTYINEQGPALQERVNNNMTQFAGEMNAFFKQRAVPIELNHYSSWFRVEAATDLQFMDLFFYHLLEKGIYVFTLHQNCFFSIEHTAEDITKIKRAFMETTIEMQNAGFLPAAPPGVSDPFPLTEAQEEIWVAAQLDEKASLPYNESFSLRLHGEFHPAALQQAVQAVISRHGALHHRFSPEGDWQKFDVDNQFELAQHDFSHTTLDKAERAAKDAIDSVLGTPFNLVDGPLVRAQVIKVADDLHYFHWTAHHIVYDGWSAVIVIDEIRTIYNAIVESDALPQQNERSILSAERSGAVEESERGQDGTIDRTLRQAQDASLGADATALWEDLLDEPDSFREYVAWETEARASDEGAEALQYWRDRFVTLPTPLQLPTDHQRPLRKTYSGTSLHFEFDSDVIAGVRAAAKREKQSLFMVLLAAYKTLLYKLTGQTDIVVGIPMAGQAMAGMDNLLGHCVNIVPIRSTFEKSATFSSLLPTLRNDFLDAQEYQPLTFGTILRELNVPRDASRSPLVEVVFNLDRHMPPEAFVGLDVEIREVPKQAINWEMFLNLYEEGDTLKADFDYNSDLYDAATMHRWLGQLQEILRAIANAKTAQQMPLNKLSVLSAAQKQQILVDWNATEQPHPTTVTIHGLIEAQVAKTPAATAWVYEGDSLSYDGINKRANRIAHYLMARGVSADTRVGLFLNRGIDMGAAVLGVLKTGATYVPLAPDYPAERVKFIMQDSNASVLITENALRPQLGVVEREVISIDGDWSRIAGFSAENPHLPLDPESIALIIYTSGSTGRPKGATLPHRSLTNFAFWYNRHYSLDASDAMILKSPFGFDAGSWEILTSLTNGGRVIVTKQNGVTDSDYMIDLMVREGVTHGFFVPTHLRMLLGNARFAECKQLRHLCIGGEAFPEDLRDKFNSVLPNVRLDNFYGPSETTIGVLTWDSANNDSKSGTTPIGRPIDNTMMYIVNDAMQPVPVGVQGELCIGGRAVGRGYWNRPKLTAEKFIDNPFAAGKLYKTGDFAAWRDDGAIEYFGRIDHQVKLRGLRIEMGEIEAGLVAHAAIDQAVVTVREDEAHDKKIIAYCVLRNGVSSLPPAELRGHLGKFVPNYMVPAAFVWMNALPVSPNGKLDRRQLPAPDAGEMVDLDSADAPRDALEFGLSQIWADVLKVPQVGIHDNFFDLGGHSLTALRLFSQVEEQYEQKLPLATLFETPTIAQMAERLRDNGWQASWSSIVPIRASGHKTPFFHVGAYMESILAFTELNEYLDDERPFYGIQPQGLDDESKIQHDIDDMAEHYISEMKMIQPEGPYLLGGHCAGAVVAYEMAKKLESRGDEIAMLAVVDSPAPNYVPPKEIPIWGFVKRMSYYLMDRRLLHAISWQMRIQLESTILYRFGSEQAKRISAMRIAHNEAYANYEIEGGYHGPMTVYRSEEYVNLYDETIHTKWAELTDGAVRYEDVTGTHATLLKDPNVEVLGEALQRNIALVESGGDVGEVGMNSAESVNPPHKLDKLKQQLAI